MSAEIHNFRPRVVMSVGRDGSLRFAATSEVDIVIVREGTGDFMAHPRIDFGLAPVRELIEGAVGPRVRAAIDAAAVETVMDAAVMGAVAAR